jgi:hypothetical protein
MTPQQQTDLQLWKQDQSQPLPASLDNVLIERCIKEFNNNEKVRIAFKYYEFGYTLGKMNIFPSGGKEIKLTAMLFFLSRTPDCKAVMPFLNSEIKDDKLYDKYGEKTILQCTRVWYAWEVGTMTEEDFDDCVVNDEFIAEIAELYNAPQTLDHLLHREFTEALRVGKTFDEALGIINLIYLQKNF